MPCDQIDVSVLCRTHALHHEIPNFPVYCNGIRTFHLAVICLFCFIQVRSEACSCAAQVSSQLERLAVELETAAHPALDELTATVGFPLCHITPQNFYSVLLR